jgi:hypothetical protein
MAEGDKQQKIQNDGSNQGAQGVFLGNVYVQNIQLPIWEIILVGAVLGLLDAVVVIK